MAGTIPYEITNPIGIDRKINKLQNKFVRDLWTTMDWNIYGRSYINANEEKKIPESYIGNNEYSRDLFLNDKTSHCLFVVDPSSVVENGIVTANVGIIFCVNIDSVKSYTHRGDEEIRNNVLELFDNEPYGFVVDEILTGVEDSFQEFDYKEFRDDMQPYHIFRINCLVSYETETSCV